ncbi:hypothetical protein Fcan01_20837 [Folsomia candida]|uniref:Uncharacterized protein n=1 Tax=Folsomia candida TaxID=158441 RepID=A0A226DGX8_FOLCA|nr:hypothetical protein Fcan01_20837 [Folsomia candida]
MPLVKALQASVILIAYITSGICRVTLFIWEKDGLLLLNGFLMFERNLVKKFRNLSPEIRKGSTLRKMVFVVATISCSSFGIIAAFQLFLSPCTPPYVVSMRTKCLNPGSSQTEEIDFFVVMAILLDASMYFHVGPVAALMIASFLMGFGACLQEYLTVISEITRLDPFHHMGSGRAFVMHRQILTSEIYRRNRKLTSGRQNFCQNCSRNFWWAVKSLTGKSNVWATRRQREFQALKSFRIYPQIQILVAMMNTMFRNFFIPAVFVIASNGIVFCLFVIIRMHGTISIAGLSYFVMLLGDFLLTVGVDLASVGDVYKKSVKVTEKWRKMEHHKGRRDGTTGRIAISLPPLKIRFGNNFVDHLTSLTVLDHCLNLTVSLLLMT